MGGSAGNKARERRKAGTSTLGGKFSSIGTGEEQKANHRLVVEKMTEVLPMIRHVSSDDLLFLQDVKIKLNSHGSAASFGWRQVEAMVRIHTEVKDKEALDVSSKKIPARVKSNSPVQ